LNKVTSVKDQGTCGDCWAFATVAYAESKAIIEQNINQTLDLSEQFLLKCTQESDCNGGYL
jgi:C1A family cysteine protease